MLLENQALQNLLKELSLHVVEVLQGQMNVPGCFARQQLQCMTQALLPLLLQVVEGCQVHVQRRSFPV